MISSYYFRPYYLLSKHLCRIVQTLAQIDFIYLPILVASIGVIENALCLLAISSTY